MEESGEKEREKPETPRKSVSYRRSVGDQLRHGSHHPYTLPPFEKKAIWPGKRNNVGVGKQEGKRKKEKEEEGRKRKEIHITD